MFQAISDMTSYHFGVPHSQVMWLAQMSLPITCVLLLPIACLSEFLSMRVLILIFNTINVVGSIIKVAAGRLYFEWLLVSQVLQLTTRVAYTAFGSQVANIWCKKNEISRGTAVTVAGMALGMGLGNGIPPMLITNQLNNSSVRAIGDILTIICLNISYIFAG